MTNAAELRFVAEPRGYWLGDRPLRGITSTLVSAGIIDPSVYTGYESARDRGTRVHAAVQYDVEGDLDEASVGVVIMGYVSAWRRFRDETGFVATEQPELLVCSPTLGYATQVDLVGTIGGKVHVINLKTSRSPAPWWSVQLAGEAIAYAEWAKQNAIYPWSLGRMSVQLADDGAYKATTYRDRSDLDVFRAVALVSAWKETHHD